MCVHFAFILDTDELEIKNRNIPYVLHLDPWVERRSRSVNKVTPWGCRFGRPRSGQNGSPYPLLDLIVFGWVFPVVAYLVLSCVTGRVGSGALLFIVQFNLGRVRTMQHRRRRQLLFFRHGVPLTGSCGIRRVQHSHKLNIASEG